VPIAGSAFRDLRFAFERRDYREVLATGEHTIALLEADERKQQFVPGAMVLIGGALLSVEHYVDAVAWLEAGLGDLTGTASEHELRGANWFHRALADTYLLLGRWDRAALYLDWLALPEQPLENRLAATRGLLFLAGARGRFDDAAFLVNAATDLARRVGNAVAEAIVEADRALAFAAQGRLHEAVTFADEVAGRLCAVGSDERQRWANQQATAVLTTLARLLAEAGDLPTADRMLNEVAVPATEARRSYARAQYDLAVSVVSREKGALSQAEAPVLAAVEQFSALGALPALALARLAEAKLADRRGHTVAARALYDRAIEELWELGLPRERADAERRRFALG
jgi:hypothetical protein